jgi:LCP family protein required for cell wall assembly
MRARRWLIGINVLVAVCLVATAAAYGYFHWQLSRVTRIAVPSVVKHAGEGGDELDRPLTVLLVGSDSRKGLAGKDRKSFGTEAQSGGERSDVILVVRLDPVTRRARALSVPRDLWVPIAGTNTSAKVNAAFLDGPERLVATLRSALGIEVDHYVQVDFTAFRGVVNSLGGVDIPFPAPTRDPFTGLDIKRPGCVHLDGDGALKYVRSRHYEQYVGGAWKEDGRQDLGRIERQHDFLRRLADQADLRVSITGINRLVSSVVTNLTVDKGFSNSAMIGLARKYQGSASKALELVELPVKVGRTHGESVVFLEEPGATKAVNRLLHGTPPSAAPPAPLAAPATGPSTSAPTTIPEAAPAAC